MAKAKAKAARKQPAAAFIPCELRQLPTAELRAEAAMAAIDINPANRPPVELIASLMTAIMSATPDAPGQREPPPLIDEPQALAVLTTKYWGVGGVRLGVAFIDNPPADLRARLLSHFNAWGTRANVRFSEASASMAEVRVNRQRGGGYWSYLGTDVLHIAKNQPTMNLDSFTMSSPEAEFVRVVRHEVGHTLGFPHEHLRRQVIGRLDERKTLDYFRRTQGWSEATTRSNVLTPVEDRAIIATPQADEDSVMAYSLPGSITKDGKPVVGGNDINETDYAFIARIYPASAPPPPPAPPAGAGLVFRFHPDTKVVEVPQGWTARAV